MPPKPDFASQIFVGSPFEHFCSAEQQAWSLTIQVIENVAHKVADVADQAGQFAELAMDLPNEMRPTMGDLLPGSNSEAA